MVILLHPHGSLRSRRIAHSCKAAAGPVSNLHMALEPVSWGLPQVTTLTLMGAGSPGPGCQFQDWKSFVHAASLPSSLFQGGCQCLPKGTGCLSGHWSLHSALPLSFDDPQCLASGHVHAAV